MEFDSTEHGGAPGTQNVVPLLGFRLIWVKFIGKVTFINEHPWYAWRGWFVGGGKATVYVFCTFALTPGIECR